MGRSRSYGGRAKGSEHHGSRSGVKDRQGQGSDRRHVSEGPVTYLGGVRVGSGPGPQHRREGPAPEAGTSTQRMLRGLAVLRGRRRMSGLLVLPLYHQHHHLRTLVDRRFLSFSSLSSVDRRSLAESRHHHGREKSEAPYVSRREIQLSPVVPQTTEKRTITVIPSPPRPLPLANSAGVMGPADSAALADSAGVRGLTGSAEPDDSLDYESAEALGTMVDDEPEVVCDSAAVADQAQDDDPAVADSAHSQKPAGDDLARGDRSADQDTPTGTTPVTGQDTSMGSDASSLTFPSLPRTISQATLVDFISMWTLMQHRMDTGRHLRTPSPGPLLTLHQPDPYRLHLEELGPQWGVPGLQTNNPGRQLDVPGGRMSPETLLVYIRPSGDRHRQNLATGTLLQSTFLQLNWGEPRVDFATFAKRDSSSLYHCIRTPGRNGLMPCQCPGTTGGAYCMRSRHSRWSLKFCRRSLNHQEPGWSWSLHCNWQRHGFRSW